jgi:hypothetical protein
LASRIDRADSNPAIRRGSDATGDEIDGAALLRRYRDEKAMP